MLAGSATARGKKKRRLKTQAVFYPYFATKVRFDTAMQVIEALKDTFGIDVADVAEPEVAETRIAQVLDS